MVDMIQSIGILAIAVGVLALAVAVVCQVKINRELMHQIDRLHNDGSECG